MTPQGPMVIVGINHENLLRMQAGLPLDIDIKKMTPPGKRVTRVVVHYAHTYEQVVDDMSKGELEIPDFVRKEARDLDAQIKREKEGRSE